MERDDQRTVPDGPPSHAADAVDDRGDLIGVDVGGYVIDGELGRGGMGVVFSATHPIIGKRAAIKVLKPSLSNNPATVERFVQEARSVNQIGHPNIVDIFAFGKLPDGRSYLVMDLLEGESLRRRVKRGPLTIAEATHVIDEIASALAAAHAKGFAHRDLKPDNIFLVEHGGRTECKLLDFGLAKLLPSASMSRTYRTATGAQLGTPDYMSPEQLRGADSVDARTDVYALGVVAFEILCAERPRRYSDGSFELAGRTIAEAIIAKANPPPELAQLVETMLAYEADQRPSLAAVRTVLRRVRTAVPSTSVVGMQVSLPAVRAMAGVATPPTGSPTPQTPETVVDAPRSRPSQPPASTGSAAGLRAPGSAIPSTKLGVAPTPMRPKSAHPIQSSPGLASPRSESKLWLIVGLLLVAAAAIALAVVLAR